MSAKTIEEIKKLIETSSYDFLRTNEHLNNNIILLGLGGSYAYGTNIETSDIDIRGIAKNTKREILLNDGFEQVVNEATDTTIYSFSKIIKLLSNCNPNVIELLGLKEEHYLDIKPIGKELLDNKKIFLSKRAIKTFGGYASQQLYRLQQKTLHTINEEDFSDHVAKTLQNVSDEFYEILGTRCHIYTNEKNEIMFDGNIKGVPVEKIATISNALNNTLREYNKRSSRNEKAIEHGKINKHMMHLVRLYYMCFDILEKEEIITYRDKEHNLLMDIRNGKYIKDGLPNNDFKELLHDLEKRFDYAKTHTNLPQKPNQKEIDELCMSIASKIIEEN